MDLGLYYGLNRVVYFQSEIYKYFSLEYIVIGSYIIFLTEKCIWPI